jgi:hypothetical protein
VAAITYPDLSNLQVVGGFLLFAAPFVLREITSGALKEAGKDLWGGQSSDARRDDAGWGRGQAITDAELVRLAWSRGEPIALTVGTALHYQKATSLS